MGRIVAKGQVRCLNVAQTVDSDFMNGEYMLMIEGGRGFRFLFDRRKRSSFCVCSRGNNFSATRLSRLVSSAR